MGVKNSRYSFRKALVDFTSIKVCTQTFIAFYTDKKEQAESIQSYYITKFWIYRIIEKKITQSAFRHTYSWVLIQTWDREWTDCDLYKKYKLSKEEIDYIESVIRPMDLT